MNIDDEEMSTSSQGLPIDLKDISPLRARASEQRASSCTPEGAKRVRVRRIDLGSCDASHSTEREEDDVGWQLARIRWLVRPATFGGSQHGTLSSVWGVSGSVLGAARWA